MYSLYKPSMDCAARMFGGGSRSHCQFTKGGLGHQLCSQHSACKNGCLERFSDAGRALLLSFWSCWDLPSFRNRSFISVAPVGYPFNHRQFIIHVQFVIICHRFWICCKNLSSGLISPDSGLSFYLFPSLSCLDASIPCYPNSVGEEIKHQSSLPSALCTDF